MADITRRSVLRAAAASFAAPLLIGTPARAATRPGPLRVRVGSVRPPRAALDAFTARTGVAVALVGAADPAPDLVVAPHDAVDAWRGAALRTTPAGAAAVDALAPGMAALAADWGGEGALRWLPAGWTTHGIAWREADWRPWSGAPSYADLWEAGDRAAGAPRALLLGAGLHLEATGALAPGKLWAAHGDDAAAATVWTKIEAWCAPRVAALGAPGARTNEGAALALTDAGSAARLARSGAAIGFAAPAEGAVVRMYGFVAPASDRPHPFADPFMAFFMERDGGMADWTGGGGMMDPDALLSLHALPAESARHKALRQAVTARLFG
ncbi:MAG: spermidine/putrescine transport system substrate-binding protein [Paracoccaceae bacterium]|jgi:spermidine/putrescine transport system substrate-binding protein